MMDNEVISVDLLYNKLTATGECNSKKTKTLIYQIETFTDTSCNVKTK